MDLSDVLTQISADSVWSAISVSIAAIAAVASYCASRNSRRTALTILAYELERDLEPKEELWAAQNHHAKNYGSLSETASKELVKLLGLRIRLMDTLQRAGIPQDGEELQLVYCMVIYQNRSRYKELVRSRRIRRWIKSEASRWNAWVNERKKKGEPHQPMDAPFE